MATRGIYKFIDNVSTHYVYKHWDNYPSAAAKFIQNALEFSWELPRFEADEFSTSFIVANKKESGDVRLMDKLEEDEASIIASLDERWIEFLYEISCKDNKLHVKVVDIRKGSCCFAGYLDEFTTKYQDNELNS